LSGICGKLLKLFITILRLSSSSRQPVPAARARNTQRVALSSGLSFAPPALFLFPRSREEKREKIKEERKEKEK